MKTIGRDFGDVARKVYATASGTLPNGKPVVVNSDGTVSVAAASGGSPALGTATVFEAADSTYIGIAFDSVAKRIVISYRDNGNSGYGTAVVGQVSGTAITFGTPVVFESTSTENTASVFDSNSDKVVIGYIDKGNSDRGTAIVGTISGDSISFGSATAYSAVNASKNTVVFDSNSNKVVFSYRTAYETGYSSVGTVSGTNISFGSAVGFNIGGGNIGSTSSVSSVFDSTNNKVVIAYRGPSNYGTGIVGTVSGTSISFGSATAYTTNVANNNKIVFDPDTGKVFIVYSDAGNSAYGTSVIGTVSNTSISFGTPAVFLSSATIQYAPVYDTSANKVFFAYSYSNKGYYALGTVSGTSISFSSPVLFNDANADGTVSAFDSNSNSVVIAYKNPGNSDYGTAIAYQSSPANLTAENYIGMSSGGVDFNIGPEAFGSEVAFESAATYFTASAYDSNANKTVVVYRDSGNSNYGTAVVGTVNPSNNSISFGTPVVFEAANTSEIGIGFDSNANKFVIAYNDAGNSGYGTAIVGTVSGTNISFGTAVVFQSTATYFSKVVFDSNSNKIVLAYKQDGTGEKGTSRVGTISGTDISFGTAVVFVDEKAMFLDATFDSNSNKVVVGFQTPNSSDSGAATVGTVSGTNISFGSKVVFNSGATNTVRCAFDSTNNKVVFAYRNAGSSNVGTAIVGTVSGTSISFGTASVFQASQTTLTAVVYDPEAKKVIITYKDQATGSNGTLIPGIVSGTSISFETKAVFNVGSTEDASASYDSGSNKVVINYRDETNSNYGTSIVYQPAFDKTVRGQVASGGAVLVNTKGAININQNALTAGQSYFVQTDGTITTTAGTPSVFAGTAVSATKLIVKG